MPHDRWHELSKDECQALLAGSHLGRVALVEGGRPLILPVNYVLDDAAVVFRTDEGSKLDAAVRGAPVAFEVDGVNRERQTGWSVLIRGQAEYVTDPTDLERLRRLPLVPWAPGAKPHYVWVRPEEVTGRRISVADLPFNWWG
jgi:nitroimidazol reductase NimA-like FMN-containing flavoprotein (pyridoxamine 5'-phosphate oxidase superfamily)